MPRKPRKLIGNAFVHSMVQGINREYIFENDIQKNKYIRLIKKYSQKYKISIIAYCIMDNHAHLLTYAENIENISLFMKETNTEYALYYNKSNKRVGYVFRNRFSSKPIYNQEYLLKCIKYIHMNPVKAEICQNEGDYNFSSYKEYLNSDIIINSKMLKNVLDKKEEILKKINSINYESLNLEKEPINLKEILEEFLIHKNLKLSQIQKNNFIVKEFIAYLISNEYEFKKQDIAKILNISRANLYRKLNGADK